MSAGSRRSWYWRRLRAMSPAEVMWRGRDELRQQAWRRRQVRPGRSWPAVPAGPPRRFPIVLPQDAASAVPLPAREELLATAQQLLEGRGEVLGVRRDDLLSPDWFLDPVTGRRAPQARYAFRIDHRSRDEAGNVKQVWELSRHHHLTVLAAAWFVSGDERYAEFTAKHLRSWWQENPFLSGVNWTSGIELGVRLISWTWIRRLLGTWAGAPELFEWSEQAANQLRWHQEYLSAFRSAGSSANNHVIAEAAGQLVASCAFPWFAESERWRAAAARLLERELQRNTFPSGVNRELGSDYHRFVAELGMVAAVEAEAAGHPLSDETWACLCRMVDAAAAVADAQLGGPRQGDGDDGRALVVDASDSGSWSSLLATGAALHGALPWWTTPPSGDVRSTLLAALAGRRRRAVHQRPRRRPSHFHDAGLTVLRTARSEDPELWCRCDAGPLGYLSIAAHGHADALSIEVRHGGVEVLADPGTYCYHGEPPWRAYFRSTVAHNTLELGGQDQSVSGGPFLWLAHGSSRPLHVAVDADDGIERWSAEHDGYRRLNPPALHRRSVQLDRGRRRLRVTDHVETGGRYPCRLAFHLGPSIRATLEGCRALLEWDAPGGPASATIDLPDRLSWTSHRGDTEPILGWYSPRFGHKEPAVTLLGSGTCTPGREELVSVVQFSC